MTAIILFVGFFVLLILGVPIAFALGGAALISMNIADLNWLLFPNIMYANIAKFTLLAIPFFVLAGEIMEKAGISEKLINFADTMVGHRKGGLATVTVVTALFFAAISGSGPATVAALGVILMPAMIKAGYKNGHAEALMGTAGSIGIVIPPSISYVVYGSITGVSIGSLFIAGLVPGILMGVSLILMSNFIFRNKKITVREKATKEERSQAFKDAGWGLLMPVIILGGIYGGLFTPTEAAAVAAVYGLFVGLFIYKTISVKKLTEIFSNSAMQTATIMLIVAAASLFAWLAQTQGISQAITTSLSGIATNQFSFGIMVVITLLIAGMFIDANSAMYIFIPIFLPIAKALNYDLLALGIAATVLLAIGQVTPPMGVNLFVAMSITGVKLWELSKAVLPYVAATLVVAILLQFFPEITLFIPRLLGY